MFGDLGFRQISSKKPLAVRLKLTTEQNGRRVYDRQIKRRNNKVQKRP